ncbi:DNA sulfur modification protein DndB [Campylobacter upsaliensis]|uniref:DNA sulfur modification protein DndB n=2 Tax=Campylobacter upsaliensis TaxID=28080 RepID=UPI002B37DDF6|nr:DNA sulfur modification protein DndB [Campylobacter upsaliensis]MEB2801353.1 DNA sulfur modification protein DndB [Campylobacter upsaliensis]
MAFETIDVYLWQKQIFNYHIAKGYLTFNQLANFDIFSEEYQRSINHEHEDKILEYLKKDRYLYLPDIVIVIRDNDLRFDRTRILLDKKDLRISRLKSYNLMRLQIKTKEGYKQCKIVDGNHRLSAIKKLLEKSENTPGENYIGVTFILTDDNSIKDELALFYYLNSKSKPLLPKDYLSKTIVEFEKADELKDIDWWLYVFRESNDKLLDILKDYKEGLEKDVIAKACSYLAKNIQNEDEQGKDVLNNFFAFLRDVVEKGNLKGILERFDELEQLAELICIIFFLYNESKNYKNSEPENEIKYFCEWLLEDAKLEKFQDFENLFKVYVNTYIPKSFKIFIAMEFKGKDHILNAIETAIQEVNDEKFANNPPLHIDHLRIDKLNKGTTFKIIDEILRQIEHRGLMIADISRKNANVYFEVGYMMALCRAKGIDNQIILLVDKSNKEVGFDLSGYQQVRYKDEDDLKKKLKNQLKEYYKTKYIEKS